MTERRATIARLDIVGFKSFSDETHLNILPGLTGIVGPNGCGKSNIVEALRWNMGETSARALRGSDSDDLIFSGTKARPPRNLAKVILSLENTKGLAPHPFHDYDELNISRQAERGHGSTYRINGQAVRARDVQKVFADVSSGARSSSIISQNRVSQLISAKPEERRHLLEEAAGITGLYVRRRDAELKLRQSENNLERTKDRQTQLSEQMAALEKQSQKARQYRDISKKIRDVERYLITTQHKRAQKSIQHCEDQLILTQQKLAQTQQNSQKIHEKTSQHSATEKAHTQLIENMRPTIEDLRVRIKIEQNNFEHSQKEQHAATERLKQIDDHLSRYQEQRQRLMEKKETLTKEISDLKDKKETLPSHLDERQNRLNELEETKRKKKSSIKNDVNTCHQEDIQQESIKNLLCEKRKHYEDTKNSILLLKETHLSLKKDMSQRDSLDKAQKSYHESYERLQKLRETSKKVSTIYQEKKLQAELSSRAFHDAKQKRAQLQQRIQVISQHQKDLDDRHFQETQRRQKLREALPSTADITTLQHDITLKKKALHNAHQQKESLARKKEDTEQNWLNTRAQYEHNKQQHHAADEEIKRLSQAITQQQRYVEEAQEALNAAQQECFTPHHIKEVQNTTGVLKAELQKQEKQLLVLQDNVQQTEKIVTKTHLDVTQKEADLSQLKGEYEGLRQSLHAYNTQTVNPLIEHISVPASFIKALASALAEGLEASFASTDTSLHHKKNILRYWKELSASVIETSPPHPSVSPLIQYINAPLPLYRALQSIFVVETIEQGEALHSSLKPGQSLVTRSGYLWRWDGFVRSDKAPSAEAVRLEQKQRLQLLETHIKKHTLHFEHTQAHLTCLQKELTSLRKELSAHQQNTQKLHTKYRLQHHATQDIEQRFSFQKERIKLAKKHLCERQSEDQTLKEQRSHAKHIKSNLASCHEDDVQKIYRDTQTLKEQLQKAQTSYQECLTALHHSETTYKHTILHHRTTQERLKEIEETCAHLSKERERYHEDYHQLTHELEHIDLKAQHESSQKDSSKLNELFVRYQKAQEDVEKYDKIVQSYQKYCSELERSITTLQAQYDSSYTRYTEQEKTLSILEKDIKELTDKENCLPNLEKLKEKIRLSQQEYDALSQDETSLTVEITHLQHEQHNHEARLTTLQQQEETLDNTWSHLKKEEDILLEQRHSIESSPYKKQPSHDTLQRSIAQNIQTLSELEKKLEQARNTLRDIQKNKKQLSLENEHLQTQHHNYREEVIRLKERLEHAQRTYKTLQQQTPLPEDVPSLTEISAQSEQHLRHTFKKHTMERDELGAVNLCAEEEYQKLSEESDYLLKEYADLSTAIVHLRHGISTINRRGRQDITKIFNDINQHIQKLFERMFGGGNAHLAMTGSDDPLEAGLEIFAQPPGKKLSALSLLSGGEQALTALSLIFAVFYCTPAPICLLDEVDAPLDDANIERFCSLLTDIVAQTKTRFLVITHHQLTMAHMDRLFGVTMEERGVSRLLSVNLDESIKMANG